MNKTTLIRIFMYNIRKNIVAAHVSLRLVLVKEFGIERCKACMIQYVNVVKICSNHVSNNQYNMLCFINYKYHGIFKRR